MNLFINTVQVVGGIITPFLLLGLIIFLLLSVNEFIKGWRAKQERLLEEESKSAPYDDIQFSQPPNPTMITVRLIKNNKIVWEQSYDKDIK